jgi:hypothetical protein
MLKRVDHVHLIYQGIVSSLGFTVCLLTNDGALMLKQKSTAKAVLFSGEIKRSLEACAK